MRLKHSRNNWTGRKKAAAALCTLFLFLCAGAAFMVYQNTETKKNPLDPHNPVLVTLWHYRVGSAKTALDSLVQSFNDTVGEEQGIVVEAYSIGNIDRLADAVLSSVNNELGAKPMPHIFTAYNTTACEIDARYGLVDLEKYFSPEELSLYQPTFLNSGRIGTDQKLKNFPIARSTECIYLNCTDFNRFSYVMNITPEILLTWEGIVQTAELYYKWSGGKAFFGAQNIINTMQAAAALEREKNGVDEGVRDPSLYYPLEAAKKIWDCYYIPYLKGYYSMEIEELQSMNPIKQGKLLMCIASTAGAVYCPDEVWMDENTHYPIQCSVLPYPVWEGEKKYAPMRGNSFCIVKSDSVHEYASTVFMKWYTQPEQNIAYAISTGYLPVNQEALTMDKLNTGDETQRQILRDAQQVSLDMLSDFHWCKNGTTLWSSRFDTIFKELLTDRAKKDREAVLQCIEEGQNREALLEKYTSRKYFEKWYYEYLEQAAS